MLSKFGLKEQIMNGLSSLSDPKTNITEIYSSDHSGDWINVDLQNGQVDRRFVKNQLRFVNPSGTAICLGNGSSRENYSLKKFENNNKRKISRYYNVIYGCNAIVREWKPDFSVVTNQLIATEVPAELYPAMYAPAEIQRRYKDSNLIPMNLRLDAGSAAVYIAAFHSARRVFLFGYNGANEEKYDNIYSGSVHYHKNGEPFDDSQWAKNLFAVIAAYSKVQFYHVGNPPRSYRTLQRLSNYNIIKISDFITLADL